MAERTTRITTGLRFALVFASLSAALLSLYYFPYDDHGPIKPLIDSLLHGHAASAGFVLRLFQPDVRVAGNEILGAYPLRIVRTCDAMDVEILLASALVAWPAPWRRRLASIAVGVVLVYLVNVLRICSLYYVGLRFPASFETAHLEVWPALILLLAVGYFVAATSWAGARAEDGGGGHA
jgi:exosortase/archaeosortase family protein